FDLAQPVRIVADAVDATNVVIPRALLEQQGCHPDALHGRPLDHDGDPFGRLVHTFVANVVACGDLLDRREALSAAAAITPRRAPCASRGSPTPSGSRTSGHSGARSSAGSASSRAMPRTARTQSRTGRRRPSCAPGSRASEVRTPHRSIPAILPALRLSLCLS